MYKNNDLHRLWLMASQTDLTFNLVRGRRKTPRHAQGIGAMSLQMCALEGHTTDA